jgi:hypothetical protein
MKNSKDYAHLEVEGDLKHLRDLDYHMERCMGILLLIELYLGESVIPLKVGIHGVTPVVTVNVGDYKQVFEIRERPVQIHRYGKVLRAVQYVSDFNFSMFVDTRAGVVGGDTFTLLV